MKLKEFIDQWGISINKFAIKSKVAPATIRKLIASDGSKDVGLSVALKIERASNNMVKCEDLISEDLINMTQPSVPEDTEE